MKPKTLICPNCKRTFLSKNVRKRYCSQNCCVAAINKRKLKDNDPKFLMWQGIKLKNGCFAKTMIFPEFINR